MQKKFKWASYGLHNHHKCIQSQGHRHFKNYIYYKTIHIYIYKMNTKMRPHFRFTKLWPYNSKVIQCFWECITTMTCHSPTHGCPRRRFCVHNVNTADWRIYHYNDIIMGTMASQITSLTMVYSTVYSGAEQRKHQSSASLAFVRGIHRGPVNSAHKGPVTRKLMTSSYIRPQRRGVPVVRLNV